MGNSSTYIYSEQVHLTRSEGLLSFKRGPVMHSRSFLAREFSPNLTLSRCQEPRPWKERFFLDPIARDTHSPNKVSTGTCIESRPIKARNAGCDGPQRPLTIGLSLRILSKITNHVAGTERRVLHELPTLTLPDYGRFARHVTRIRPRPGCRGHMRNRLFSSWGETL
jgi:hypothetical protein